MESFAITLTAGVPWTFGAGRFFMVVESAPADLEIQFFRSGQPREASGMSAGFKLGPLPPAERWETGTLTSATGGAVTFVMGDDLFDFSPPGIVRIGLSTSPAMGQAAVGVAAAIVAAANSARVKGITVKAAADNTDPVYIGASVAVTTGDGFELQPGEALTLETTGEVAAISTAAAQSVCWVEE